ncbi:MAG: hypothetical protein IKI20_01615 [Lachnospiraceae bacterium]|nr:hypothetical protein [Lachnospiraceae bacterium]
MQNNVYFHCNSPYAGAKMVVVVNRQTYTVPRNQDPLVLTFPVGVNVSVKIKGIKSFWNGTGANKTYTREVFVPNENAIVDVMVSIGKAVVSIDIKERNQNSIYQAGPMMGNPQMMQQGMQPMMQPGMTGQPMMQQPMQAPMGQPPQNPQDAAAMQQKMAEMQRQMEEMQRKMQQMQGGQGPQNPQG